jgi:hypothetical protein
MKFKIVPEDNLFTVNGISKKGFIFTLSSDIHAVSWKDDIGEIEYKEILQNGVTYKKPNLKIYDIKDFEKLITSWNNFVESDELVVDDVTTITNMLVDPKQNYDSVIYDMLEYIDYSYEIIETKIAEEFDDKKNIVDTVSFNLIGKFQNKEESCYYIQKLPKYSGETEFKEFDDLREIDIINWIQEIISEEILIQLKYSIAEKIHNNHYDKIVTISKFDLPWIPKPVEIDETISSNTDILDANVEVISSNTSSINIDTEV